MGLRVSFFYPGISISFGVLIFFLLRIFVPEGSLFSDFQSTNLGAFAVLTLDESHEDRFIRESLTKAGFEGVISKSAIEVPVDDFGILRMVPLDSFHNQIASFDPRDTGFAAKLTAFFTQNGKRFFFLPLDNFSGNQIVRKERQITSVLGDIPFTFTVLGQKRPLFWYFLLNAAACAFALFFSRSRRLFLFQLPVLLAFGWSGFFAFPIAAILCGIWELLREPLKEFFAVKGYKRKTGYARTGIKGALEKLKPFRLNCILAFLFLVLLFVLSAVWGFPVIPLLAGCFGFFFVYFLAFRAETERARESRHTLFNPVLLLPIKVKTFHLFPFLLSFGLVSVAALFLPGFSPARQSDTIIDTRYFVSFEDFYKHLDFQRSFSFRPMNQRVLYQDAYLLYYLGDDGLIAGSTDVNFHRFRPGYTIPEPVFPLEKLMDFLINYHEDGSDRGQVRDQSGFNEARLTGIPGRIKEWILVTIVLAFCLFDLIRPDTRRRDKKAAPISENKRIAA